MLGRSEVRSLVSVCWRVQGSCEHASQGSMAPYQSQPLWDVQKASLPVLLNKGPSRKSWRSLECSGMHQQPLSLASSMV